MNNKECLDYFENYLLNEKKASTNTLSSYLRDIRQLGEYLDTHTENSILEATEEKEAKTHLYVTGMLIQKPEIGDFIQPASSAGARAKRATGTQRCRKRSGGTSGAAPSRAAKPTRSGPCGRRAAPSGYAR